MTEWLQALVADWGALALGIITFLSCLAVPVPSSLMMLTAGAFAASGDLDLTTVAASALIGAVLGDQTGYQLGRLGYRRAEAWLLHSPARAALLRRARDATRKGGGIAVFLSRWLFSVLGPYVNLLAPGVGLGWLTFTAMGIAGEIVWVILYVGLGYVAGGQLEQAGDMLGDALGLLGSLAMAAGLGWMLLKRHRKRHPGTP
ncbi:DedA family protein [Pararhodobacter marinus]|uniref:DedA family protein n=1 Tax=Pararhodobacter marinus TaxID=2184063 RepID=A0A2U2CEJ3_9RHOB|nr:VTT domain-containing protein [Pararhodobacter marinus]PWE30249.1 DedA family protein [Pararhodobacter marinus]